jgi:TatD DNase family protein
MEHAQAKDSLFIDAHFHFDLFKTPKEILIDIETHGVKTIAVTNAPSVFHHTLKVAETARFLLPAIGLHPELVATHGRELSLMWSLLDKTRFIGEVGLDYVTSDQENRRAQRNVFSQIVERCAAYGDKILSVHSRRSASDVISTVGDKFPGAVILHWFSGSRRELERAIEFGFYFSVGPAMLKSKTGLALVAAMPKNRVLTETDGPFVQTDGRPARPSDIATVIGELGQLWQQSSAEAKEIVSQNFASLVS